MSGAAALSLPTLISVPGTICGLGGPDPEASGESEQYDLILCYAGISLLEYFCDYFCFLFLLLLRFQSL